MSNAAAPFDPRRLAHALGGEVVGRDSLLVPGPGHSRKDRSLSIRLGTSAPDGFLVYSFAGDDPIVCKDHVRRALGLHDYGGPAWRPRRKPRGKPSRSPSRTGLAPEFTDLHSERQWSKAHACWRHSVPIAGTPAERYLRARKYSGPLPATLRYLPPHKREHHSAMIAAFGVPNEPRPGALQIKDEQITGVHLTLIAPDGRAKAGTGRDKLMIGRSSGSPIVLAPPNDLLGLVISEGIEDALSLHEASGCGAWAAGSASRLPGLAEVVPDYIDCVTIVADADEAGLSNAKKLAHALGERGLYVEVKTLEQN